MFLPNYKIHNPDHLSVFAKAHATLPQDVYEFFVEGYKFYRDDERSPELVDDEISVIQYLTAARGNLEIAWSAYHTECKCTLDAEGLNPIFWLYKEEVFDARGDTSIESTAQCATAPSLTPLTLPTLRANRIDCDNPSLYMDNELVDDALDRLPRWLYDMLMPRLHHLEQEYFNWMGAISYLVNAGGNVDAAQDAIIRVNPNAGEDPALPTGKILITLRQIQWMIEGATKGE